MTEGNGYIFCSIFTAVFQEIYIFATEIPKKSVKESRKKNNMAKNVLVLLLAVRFLWIHIALQSFGVLKKGIATDTYCFLH